MTIINLQCLAFLASALLFAGCSRSTPEARPEGARLSTSEVIRIAKQAASQHGETLSNYKEPQAHFKIIGENRRWHVSFVNQAAVVAPGAGCSVSVDDQTGETQFIGGR